MTREQRHEARFSRAHALFIKRPRRGNPDESSEVDEAEIQGDDLVNAERAAAARPGTSFQINDVIEQIWAKQNLLRPTSPPPILPQARAGKL